MNQLAKAIADIATSETKENATGETKENAPARGRAGGLKGAKGRAEKLSPEKRSEIARKAAAKRWGS
jgi:hypothetical protein